MLKITFICLLVGLAIATPVPEHNAWKKNTEYKYRVQTRTLAGLPDVGDQYTGHVIEANLLIRSRTNGLISGKFEHARSAYMHAKLNGWDEDISNKQLNFEPLPLTDSPFDVEYKNGVINNIYTNKDVPNWEVNVIKAAVGQFQIDMQGENLIPSRHNQKPEDEENNASYKTMEDTVTGKCPTHYTVFPLPEHVLLNRPQIAPLAHLRGNGEVIGVVKAINYSNCEQIPSYHFGLPYVPTAEYPANNLEGFLSRSSVNLAVLTGNMKKFTIQSSITTEKSVVSPNMHSKEKAMVVSRMNVTLESVTGVSGDFEELSSRQSVGNLVYVYDRPFASDNYARPGRTNGLHQHKLSKEHSAESSEERREEELINKRNRRGANVANNQQQWGQQNQAEDSSEEIFRMLYNNQDYQPRPTIQNAPENPLLPYAIGHKGQSIKSAINVVQESQKSVRRVAEEIQNPAQIPEQQTLALYENIVDLIRIMNAKELQEVSRQIYAQQQSSQEVTSVLAWKIWTDAMANAGTGPALYVMKEWIMTMKIRDEPASQLIASIPHNAQHPTQDYVKTFYELCTSSQVKQQVGVNETCILSLGDLLRVAFVDYKEHKARYPVDSYHSFASENEKHNFIAKEFIPYLENELAEAVKSNNSQAASVIIRALGNIAHPLVFSVFKPYLEGDRYVSQHLRLLMVVSMDHLAKIHPKESVSVLHKIYANSADSIEIRTAAVFQLMRANPPASMLQRMAEYTYVEPSMQVRAAIKSSIEQASQLKTREYAELARNAQSAVKMLNPETYGLQYAHKYLQDYVANEMNYGYKQSVEYITGEESIMPKYFHHSLRLEEGGFKRQQMSASAMVSSIRSLVYGLHDLVYATNPAKHQNTGSEWAEKVARLLNIKMDPLEKFEANLLVQILGGKRFFAIDEKSIEQLPRWLGKLSANIREGHTFNFTKMYSDDEITISYPTAVGFPFYFSLRKPTLINLGAHIKQQSTEKYSEKINLLSEIRLVVSSKIQSKVGFVSPFDSKLHVASYDRNIQVNLPIRSELEWAIKDMNLRVKIEPLNAEQNQKLIHYSTWPSTARLDLLNIRPDTRQPDTHIIHVRPQHVLEQSFGAQESGMVFKLKGKSEQKYIDAVWFMQQFQNENDIFGALLALWYDEGIQHTVVDVEYDAENSSSRQMEAKFAYKQINEKTVPQSNENNANQEQHYDAAHLASVPQDQQEVRQQHHIKQAVSGLRQPWGSALDVSVKYSAQNNPQYIGSFVYAQSQVNNQHRHLVFLSKTESNNQYQLCSAATTKGTQQPYLNFIEALKAPANLKADWQIKYGEKCEQGAEIHIKANFEKTEERKSALQASPLAQLCSQQMQQQNYQLPACANVTQQARRPNQVSIEIKYENIGLRAQNATQKLYTAMRYLGYPYYEENFVNATGSGAQNLIKIRVNAHPEDFESVNVTITTPQSESHFRNIRGNWLQPATYFYTNTAPLVYIKAALVRQVHYDSAFVLDNNAATTFNNRTFKVALGHCYHVLVHHSHDNAYLNEQHMTFTVLARDSANSNKLKEVKVIYNYQGQSQEIDLIPSISRQQQQSRPRADINIAVQVAGKPIQVSDEHAYIMTDSNNRPYARVQVQPSQEVSFQLYNTLVLYFDGERVKITIDDKYRGQVRGIAGTHNGEPWIDFMAPQNCLLKDSRDFVASYALADETCQGPAKEQHRRAKNAECIKRMHHYVNVVSDKDSHTHSRKSHNQCVTKHQTRYTLENNGKTVCFTTRAMPTCSKGCRPAKNIEKSVQVHCVQHSNAVALYKNNIDKGASPDFSGKPVTKSIKITVPVHCN